MLVAIIVVMVVLALAGVVAFVTLGGAGAVGAITSIFGSDDPVTVTRAARIIPVSSEGTPLERYVVRIRSAVDEQGDDIDLGDLSEELKVSDSDGFAMRDLDSGLPEGTYVLEIDDGEETLVTPPVVVDEELGTSKEVAIELAADSQDDGQDDEEGEDNGLTILRDVTYAYENDDGYDAYFKVSQDGDASLQYYAPGISATIEDFYFPWDDAETSYELEGARSGYEFELTFTPAGSDCVRISVVCQQPYYAWEGMREGESTWSDAVFEVVDEGNPLSDFESIPADAVEFNNHYYCLFELDAIGDWDSAREYCEELGGHLATITSQEENSFLYEYIRECGYESAYFGLTRGEEGTWCWCTGELVDYTNWANGEPNNESGDEDYGMFYYKYTDGKWNDGDFGGSTQKGGTAFICEWEK